MRRTTVSTGAPVHDQHHVVPKAHATDAWGSETSKRPGADTVPCPRPRGVIVE